MARDHRLAGLCPSLSRPADRHRIHASRPQIRAVWANDSVTNNDLQRAERLSVPVTLLVLLIAFGALVAAIVPVLLAVTAVG